MSRDILIIPTYSRPEMLWACLEHVAKCAEAQDLDIRIAVDAHLGQPMPPLHEISEVVGLFPQLSLKLQVRGAHPYHGNSYNVMESYKDAADQRPLFCFMLEDDVMPEPDFFAWHYRAQRNKVFCSVGVQNTRSGAVVSASDYASLGVCFPYDSLKLVAAHARHEYYSDMRGYCVRTFGPEFAKEDVEQDGLILRIMGAHNGLSVWPMETKARHIGWYGYHRPGNRPKGTLQQRYEQVMERAAVVCQ
jgi:hypothetical protein